MSHPVAQTCDTSVLIPALLSWHERHDDARRAIQGVSGVPAHVLVESYSVLTRLPAPFRLAPTVAADLLARLPGTLLALSGERHADMLVRLAAADVKGGATYDGLVGATAVAHSRVLLTLDRRALPTYEAVGALARTI